VGEAEGGRDCREIGRGRSAAREEGARGGSRREMQPPHHARGMYTRVCVRACVRARAADILHRLRGRSEATGRKRQSTTASSARKPRRNDTRAGANWALEVMPSRGMFFHPRSMPQTRLPPPPPCPPPGDLFLPPRSSRSWRFGAVDQQARPEEDERKFSSVARIPEEHSSDPSRSRVEYRSGDNAPSD